MQIFVQTPSHSFHTLDVDYFDTIESIKCKIEEMDGIPVKIQRVIFNGKQLPSHATVRQSNIQKESTLHVMLSLLGGSSFMATPEQQDLAVVQLLDKYQDMDPDFATIVVARNASAENYLEKAFDYIATLDFPYPKDLKPSAPGQSVPVEKTVDYAYCKDPVRPQYRSFAFNYLLAAFPHIKPTLIALIMKQYNNHLYPSWLSLLKLNHEYEMEGISIIYQKKKYPPEGTDTTSPRVFLFPKPPAPGKKPKCDAAPKQFTTADIRSNLREPITIPTTTTPDAHSLRQELQYITEEKKAKTAKYEREKLIKRQYLLSEAKGGGDLWCCDICLSDRVNAEVARCPNGHPVCIHCLKDAVKNVLGKKDPVVRCLTGGHCTAAYTEQAVEEAITRCNTFIRWHENLILYSVMHGHQPHYSCPFCNYTELLPEELPPLQSPTDPNYSRALAYKRAQLLPPVFHCKNRNCGQASCTFCNLPAHTAGTRCPKQKEVEQDDLLTSLRNTITEAMSNARIRQCKCGMSIIKIEGCNRLQCTVCHQCYCFLCDKELPEPGYTNPYDHFHQGACPLFSDSLEHDRQRVQDAAQRAYNKWKAAHPDYTGPLPDLQQYLDFHFDNEARSGTDPGGD